MSKIYWPPQPATVVGPGTVKWNYKGAWKSGAAYTIGDVVTVGSVTYLASEAIPPGTIPSQDARWVPVGASQPGAKGDKGDAGTPGAPGAPAVNFSPPVDWKDLVLENGWAAKPGDTPQWGEEADGTVWLRGIADHLAATSSIIAHLPNAALPFNSHYWWGFFQGVHILGPGYAAPQGGAIVADGIATDAALFTSYRAAGDGGGVLKPGFLEDPLTYTKSPTPLHYLVRGTTVKRANQVFPLVDRLDEPRVNVPPLGAKVLFYLPTAGYSLNWNPPMGGQVRLGALELTVDNGVPFVVTASFTVQPDKTLAVWTNDPPAAGAAYAGAEVKIRVLDMDYMYAWTFDIG